jgi:putative resolvase
MNDSWLSVGEAANILGISITTLRHWTDEGYVTAFRTVGGHRRYQLSHLIEFRRRSEEDASLAEPPTPRRQR